MELKREFTANWGDVEVKELLLPAGDKVNQHFSLGDLHSGSDRGCVCEQLKQKDNSETFNYWFHQLVL